MNLIRKLRFRLHALFRGAQLDREMDDEMLFHLEQEARESGAPPDEGRRAAALAFGGREPIREEIRDARGVRWIENTLRDFRHAVRGLRKSPISARAGPRRSFCGSSSTFAACAD